MVKATGFKGVLIDFHNGTSFVDEQALSAVRADHALDDQHFMPSCTSRSRSWRRTITSAWSGPHEEETIGNACPIGTEFAPQRPPVE